ncbi:transglutaminase family protein [Microvirga antarctica]|uniref:transglutaminase family protein n=1 Tax=Microvirga antarctica TaxID=2819233 RepID=UPI001B306733|nr:transglutaminase family protein [Microvirga antarctica]
MRIRISHDTTYTYSEPVNAAMQLLRLTPRGHDGQRVISWSIETDCGGRLIRREDWYGNVMHSLYASGPIDHIGLKVVGEVVTTELDGIVRGAPERFPEKFYLRGTALTEIDSAMRDFADSAIGHLASPLEKGHVLMGALLDRLTFDTGATTATTSAGEAFAAGHGVCQDFTHIFLAAARHAGMPARYVSGYLHKADQEQQDAGHAWAEAYIEDLGWVSFDPTNGVCATQHYVRLATGLDYLDAAPVRGSYYGISREALDVSLRIESAGQQSQA